VVERRGALRAENDDLEAANEALLESNKKHSEVREIVYIVLLLWLQLLFLLLYIVSEYGACV